MSAPGTGSSAPGLFEPRGSLSRGSRPDPAWTAIVPVAYLFVHLRFSTSLPACMRAHAHGCRTVSALIEPPGTRSREHEVDDPRVHGGRDLVGTVALGDGGRLDLDHDLRLEEPGDAEERAHGLAAGLGPERHQLPGRTHEAIDVGRIEVQADDVGRLHAGRLQHLDEVRPGLARLRYDVARVQRRTLRVVRGLAGHVQDALTTLHLDRLVDVKRAEPRLRIDRTDFHR